MSRNYPNGLFYRRACDYMGINPDTNPNYVKERQVKEQYCEQCHNLFKDFYLKECENCYRILCQKCYGNLMLSHCQSCIKDEAEGRAIGEEKKAKLRRN